MGREIRFRAWCLDSKKFLKGDFSLGIESGEFRGIYGDIFENVELMQFTGLTDKNGVEIYEDDLLNICFTSESGKYIHDCIYRATIDIFDGLVFVFEKLMWEKYSYNQYPIITRLKASNLLSSEIIEGVKFLTVSDQFTVNVERENDYPFNNFGSIKFASKYFEVMEKLK